MSLLVKKRIGKAPQLNEIEFIFEILESRMLRVGFCDETNVQKSNFGCSPLTYATHQVNYQKYLQS